MKFYMRDAALAIEGMQGLTLEQVGAYNLLLDHLYCRDGILPNDDELIRAMLDLDPRHWRRLKRELMAAGKIRITTDGLIEANGVTSTLLRAEVRSKLAQHAVNVRWKRYKNAKEINGTAILGRNTSTSISNKSELLTESETSGTDAVDNGDNFGLPQPHSTTATAAPPQRQSIGTGELAAVIRAKGWR